MAEEQTETLITDNLREKITADLTAENAGNIAYWQAIRAVIEAIRAYRAGINDHRMPMPDLHDLIVRMFAALAVLDTLEKHPEPPRVIRKFVPGDPESDKADVLA